MNRREISDLILNAAKGNISTKQSFQNLTRLIPNELKCIEVTFELIKHQFRASTTTEKLNLLYLVDILFSKSGYFKGIVLRNFRQLIEAICNIKFHSFLSQSKSKRNPVCLATLEICAKWSAHIGKSHTELSFALEYLQSHGNSLRMTMDGNKMLADRQDTIDSTWSALLNNIFDEINQTIEDMINEIIRLRNLFTMVIPKAENIFLKVENFEHKLIDASLTDNANEDSNIENLVWEKAICDETIQESEDGTQIDIGQVVQECSLGSTSYKLAIQIPCTIKTFRNADNKKLFDILQDGIRLIQKVYLPKLNEWNNIKETFHNNKFNSIGEIDRMKLQRICSVVLNMEKEFTKIIEMWEELDITESQENGHIAQPTKRRKTK